MTRYTIDRTKVKEEKERMFQERALMQAGERAAEGLLWFGEYAKPMSKASDVLRVKLELLASSTPNANVAQDYINRAVISHLELILEDAIALAQREYDSAERLRRDTYEARHVRLRRESKPPRDITQQETGASG